jgi:ABC-2 type transport system ATP-binding protein
MVRSSVISVKKLTKLYGSAIAISDISFEVKSGEILAILGPNGAGKTSTIEILEGYRKRTSGKVSVLGTDPEKGDRVWKSRLGVVLQSTSLDSRLKVGEALELYARLYPNPRNIESVLELLDLTDVVLEPIGNLSGGQQRRVDLALGIIGDPELLFLDEPTTGFDPAARRSSWQIIKNLCAEGLTVVLTTHYMEEARVLADKLIIVADGKIIANDAPTEIGKSLKHITTISFSLNREFITKLPKYMFRQSTINGKHVSIMTRSPVSTLEKLIIWSKQNHTELSDILVSRPTLEDIYLQLVHKSRNGDDWDE